MRLITGLALLLIWFLTLMGFQTPPVKAEIPYQLLKVTKPSDRDSGVGTRLSYFISVQNFLDKSAVENLICGVIEKQKPPQGVELGIQVFQGLETISTLDLVLGGEVYRHDLAIYISGSNYGRLSILRNPEGARLTPIQTYDFDYVQGCPKR